MCRRCVTATTCGFDTGIFFEQADVAAIFFGVAEATRLTSPICFTRLSKLSGLFLSALLINDRTVGTCGFLCVTGVGGRGGWLRRRWCQANAICALFSCATRTVLRTCRTVFCRIAGSISASRGRCEGLTNAVVTAFSRHTGTVLRARSTVFVGIAGAVSTIVRSVGLTRPTLAGLPTRTSAVLCT